MFIKVLTQDRHWYLCYGTWVQSTALHFIYLCKTNFYKVAEEVTVWRGEVRGESYDTQTQPFSKL